MVELSDGVQKSPSTRSDRKAARLPPCASREVKLGASMMLLCSCFLTFDTFHCVFVPFRMKENISKSCIFPQRYFEKIQAVLACGPHSDNTGTLHTSLKATVKNSSPYVRQVLPKMYRALP